jgi:hypothetical protein
MGTWQAARPPAVSRSNPHWGHRGRHWALMKHSSAVSQRLGDVAPNSFRQTKTGDSLLPLDASDFARKTFFSDANCANADREHGCDQQRLPSCPGLRLPRTSRTNRLDRLDIGQAIVRPIHAGTPVWNIIVTCRPSSSRWVDTLSEHFCASRIILTLVGRISAWNPEMPRFFACSTKHRCKWLPKPVRCHAGATMKAVSAMLVAGLTEIRCVPDHVTVLTGAVDCYKGCVELVVWIAKLLDIIR